MEKSVSYSADNAEVSQTCDYQLKESNVVTPSNLTRLFIENPLKADVKYQHQPSVLYRYLYPVLECLIKQTEAVAFREPVDTVKLKIPDYFDIVKNPMDLSTIRTKLHTGQYRSGWEFIDDVWLMFENAWLYNKKTTRVYKDCTKLSSLFKGIINDPMVKLGYCCGQYYLFDPKVLFCVSKKDCIIPKFKLYWNYKDSYNLCKSCYDEVVGDVILANSSRTMSIKKDEFIMKYNTSVKKETLIECFHCGLQHHKICALYLEHIWKDGFLCDKCCILLNKERVPNKFRAKNLNRFKLDSYIEERVSNLLRNKGCNSEVIIRLVHNSRKSISVKEAVKSRYVEAGLWPEQFPYTGKVLLAFQQIDHHDVCFFSMFVQEYDSFCPAPNGRCVYISYLDSIHFFTPREFRTLVYHEILVGYLDFVKNLGYRKVHIWACPPKEGEDFVFYCHPSDQKIPSTVSLLEWYKVMLDKAISEKIVKDYKDIYTQAVEDKLQHVTELPYFDGDFLPITLEQEISKLNMDKDVASSSKVENKSSCSVKKNNANNKKRKSPKIRKGRKYLKSGKTISCYTVGDPLTDKILSFLQYYKELFLVVHLNNTEELPETSTVVELDPEISSGLMNSRESFLEFCRENDLEFCSLRRSKFSTIVLLYELHKEDMDTVFCNLCRKNLETGFHCNICKDFDLCSNCYNSNGHEHEMEIFNINLPAPSYKNTLSKCSTKHISKCKDPDCVIYEKPVLESFLRSNEGTSSQRSLSIQSRQPEYVQKSGVPVNVINNSCYHSVETSKATKNDCYDNEKVLFPTHSISSDLPPLVRNVQFVPDIKGPNKDTYCVPGKGKPYLCHVTNSLKTEQNPTYETATSVLSSLLSASSSPTSESLSYLHKIPMSKISAKSFNSDLSNVVASDKSSTSAEMNLNSTTSAVSGVSSNVQHTSSGDFRKLVNTAVCSNISNFTRKLQGLVNDSITKAGGGSSEILTNKQTLNNCQTNNIQPKQKTVTSVEINRADKLRKHLSTLSTANEKVEFYLRLVKLKSNQIGSVASNSKTENSMNEQSHNKSNFVRNTPSIVSNTTPALNTRNPSNFKYDTVKICKPKPPVFVSTSDINQCFNSENSIRTNNKKNIKALNETQSALTLNKNNTLCHSPIADIHRDPKNDVTSNVNAYFSILSKSDFSTGFSSSTQQTFSTDINKISNAVTENDFLSSSFSSKGKYSSQVIDTHSNPNVAQVQQVNFSEHIPITSYSYDSVSYRTNFVLNKNEMNKHGEVVNQNTSFGNQPFECNIPKSSENGDPSKVNISMSFRALSQNSKEHVLVSRNYFGTTQLQTKMSSSNKNSAASLQQCVQRDNVLDTFDIPHQSQMETSGNVNNRLSLFQQSDSVHLAEANNYIPPTHSFLASNSVAYVSNANLDSGITYNPVITYASGNTSLAHSSVKNSVDDVWSRYSLSSTATQNKNCSFEPYVVKSIQPGNSYDTNEDAYAPLMIPNDPVSTYPTYLAADSNKIIFCPPPSYSNCTLPSTHEVDKFVNLGNYVVSKPDNSGYPENPPSNWLPPNNSHFSLESHLPDTDSSNKNNYIFDNNGNISNESIPYESSLSDIRASLKASMSDKVSNTNLLNDGSILVQSTPAQLEVCLLEQPDVGNWCFTPANYYSNTVTYSDKNLVANNGLMKLRPELRKRQIFRYMPGSKRGRGWSNT